MKIKTQDLTGPALDWAVAKCEEFMQDGDPVWERGYEPFAFSTDWSQGGPIIEREGISLYLDTNNLWQANMFDGNPGVFGTGVEGETALIAAMRCFVASKLGDEVEIPEELK